MPSQIIFGCSSVGDSYTTNEEVEELVAALQELGITRLDTAARYPPLAPGESERLLGANGVSGRLTVDTKVMLHGQDPKGSLSADAIHKSLPEQFARLGVSKVNVLYCHAPDTQTPLEEQLAAFDQHYRDGHFSHLGVSNFPPDMVEEMVRVADDKGYVKPSVYQGQYNLLAREHEATLFPILKKHGIAYIAYSPLAGGFLTGKLSQGITQGTRFAEGNPIGQGYRSRYDKPEMHEAIAQVRVIVQQEGMTMTEAALRWIVYHSTLAERDGVVLGGSKVEYLEQNMAEIGNGPLPTSVVEKLNAVWSIVDKATAPR